MYQGLTGRNPFPHIAGYRVSSIQLVEYELTNAYKEIEKSFHTDGNYSQQIMEVWAYYFPAVEALGQPADIEETVRRITPKLGALAISFINEYASLINAHARKKWQQLERQFSD